MNAKIKTNYQIEIGEYRLDLTKDQAMELLSILQKELIILAPPAPIQFVPDIPDKYYRGDRFDPVNPFPDKNVIWCNRPSSYC